MFWSWFWAILIGAVIVLLVVRPRFLTCGPRGQIRGTLLWYAVRVLGRYVHRVEYVGLEHVPTRNTEGPLVVVANHTGGVDPLLLQGAFPALIRWMVAEVSMSEDFAWFWNWLEVFPVSRDGRDSGPARQAIRALRGGDIVGIFPEGGIENPPGEIRPFLDGAGFIIAKSEAPVLLAWISGTPFSESVFGSIMTPSRARVEFLGRFEFNDMKPDEIVARLRELIAERSGWPLNDEILPTARSAPLRKEKDGTRSEEA